MSNKQAGFKPRKDIPIEAKSKRDPNMDNVRIVQKNLVFVSGLPASIADPDLLKSNQYFGRYGKVSKVVTNPQQNIKKPSSYQAYVTYFQTTDAAIAIIALDGFNFEQKPLKVSFGTTKYCSHFLRGYQCLNSDCFYLHQFDRKNQVFNKDTKAIFQQQNEEAQQIVQQNLEQIVERIVTGGQQMPDDGFPSLMQMMEFLVQQRAIDPREYQRLLKKHRQLKAPKLITKISSPASLKTKPQSPKQIVKLTKSNSFSTVGSPSKSQAQLQNKLTQETTEKQKIENIVNDSKQMKQKQKQKQREKQRQKAQQRQKSQKKQKIAQIEARQNKNRQKNEQATHKQQQIETVIQKQFLKHIFKLNENSKSKMNFAGQPRWQQMHKIKEIVQKHLIISN